MGGIQVTKESVDIGVVVRDGEAMLRFYRDTLGLEHEGDLPMPLGGTMHRLRAGTSVVKLVVLDEPPEASAPPGGIRGATGVRYWTISVSNLDDVVAAAERDGYRVPIPRQNVRPGVDIAMIEDPDGTWVELLEATG